MNWEEGNSYASASSLALSARESGSRPNSATGVHPGSRLGPGSGPGLHASGADLSELDSNPFAVGGAASGPGLGSGSGHELRYDEDGFLLESAEASRRTSRASGGGDAGKSAEAKLGADAAPASRTARWSADSGLSGSEATVVRSNDGAHEAAAAGAAAASGSVKQPARHETAGSDTDSEEDFLAQVRLQTRDANQASSMVTWHGLLFCSLVMLLACGFLLASYRQMDPPLRSAPQL